MRINRFAIALAATLAVAALPMGAARAEAKIGVVNVARLLQEAPQAQAASQALESEFASRRRDLENQQKDLKALLILISLFRQWYVISGTKNRSRTVL